MASVPAATSPSASPRCSRKRRSGRLIGARSAGFYRSANTKPDLRVVTTFRILMLKRSISTAKVGLVLVGMLSLQHPAYQHDAAGVFPDMPKRAAADISSAVLTAH